MSSLASIGCKLPQGLQLTHKGKTVVLVGANASGNRYGFGITPGVDADWFDDWATTDGKDFPALKNGSIFAIPGNAEKAKDAAKERRADDSVQTGLEPLNPAKPGGGVEPTDETKKELDKAQGADVK